MPSALIHLLDEAATRRNVKLLKLRVASLSFCLIEGKLVVFSGDPFTPYFPFLLNQPSRGYDEY